jgi:hypothetical protein
VAEPEPAAERPLWTCPRCGHRFVTANIWHSCSRYTLDDAFASSTPEARAAFERFVELVERCGPVTVIPQKTRIVLMDRVRFAGAVVRRDRVTLSFALSRVVERPWITRLETYDRRWNAHRFDARTVAEVDRCDGLPELLCESYLDLGRQRGRPGAARR